MALPTFAGLAGSLLGGGGGGGAAPAGPVTFTPTFGNASFGSRYLGDSAVKAAPAIEQKPWLRAVAWIVGALAVVGIVWALARRKKG